MRNNNTSFTLVFCLLMMLFFSINVKAQSADSSHVKAVKAIVTDAMKNDMTGMYRVGIPPYDSISHRAINPADTGKIHKELGVNINSEVIETKKTEGSKTAPAKSGQKK